MNKKTLYDIEASVSILGSNIKSYNAGNKHAYRVIALELRKLLCDKHRGQDISLIRRVFKDIRLHPLCGDKNKIDENTSLYIPGTISFDGKGNSYIESLFDKSQSPIVLDKWLEQKLFDNRITVRELIRSVADKEAAHADEEYNETLKKTKTIKLSSDDYLCSKAIISIGEYIYKIILKEFSKRKSKAIIEFINNNLAIVSNYVISKYNKHGRGVIVLKLSEFEQSIKNDIEFPYTSPDEASGYFRRDKNIVKEVINIIETYDPTKHFLMLMIGFNNELELYQQKLNIK